MTSEEIPARGRCDVDRGRGYESDPETALLQLLECVEDYLVEKRHQEFRREVTEYRVELGERLIDEAFEQHGHAATLHDADPLARARELLGHDPVESMDPQVDIALDTPRERAKGVIGRYPEPNERYVFDLDRPMYYPVHMIGVRRPLKVTWLLDGEIVHRKTLRPWIGVGMAKADTVIEERPPEE